MSVSDEIVVCLGCGGVVGATAGAGPSCGCPPPSVAPRSSAPSPYRHERRQAACPRCNGRLSERRYADLTVLDCLGCAGLFLDMDTLLELRAPDAADKRLALPKRPRVQETEVRYLACPLCAATMNRTVFGRISGVIVDVCPEHGVWFDAGEINAVISFIEQGGLLRAEQKLRAEREEENRRLTAQLKREIQEEVSLSGVRKHAVIHRESAFYESLSALFGWRP